MNAKYKKIANSLAKRLINFINIHSDFYIAHKPDFQKEGNGFGDFEKIYTNWIAHTKLNNAGDIPRLFFLFLALRRLEDDKIIGAVAELGVFKGITAKFFREMAPNRRLYLLDTFEGFNEKDVNLDVQNSFSEASKGSFACSIELVKKFVGDNGVNYIKGYFPQTANQLPENEKYALVHLDADLYQPQLEGLRYFYQRMSVGGMIILHDCTNSFTGSKKALDEFFIDKPEKPVLMPDKSGSAVIIKI